MRIAITTGIYPPDGGGAERATGLLAEGLVKLGHEVTVVTTAERESDDRAGAVRTIRIAAGDGWIGKVISRPFFRRVIWNLRELLSVRRARRSFSEISSCAPDLVVTGNIKGLGGRLPARLREFPAPHVHVVHDFSPVEPIMLRPGDGGRGLRNRLWSAVTRRLWGSPELVVYPSEWLRGLVVSHGIFPDSKAVVLANPVGGSPSAMSHAQVGYGHRLLFVGALEPHKGALWLVRMLRADVSAEGWTLDIVGEGSESAELEAIVAEDTRVRIHGTKRGAELEPFWDEADALVVPSRCLENAPLVIVEASARRLPVMAADVGGIAESVFPGENGWLFDPEDDTSFREALRSAVSPRARAALRWSRLPPTVTAEAYAKALLESLALSAPDEPSFACVDCGARFEGGRCPSCGREYAESDGVLDCLPREMSDFKREEARYHDKATEDAAEIHQLDSWRNVFYHRRGISRLRPVAPGGWVAELAGGSGADGALALRFGLNVLETDISADAVRIACRELGRVEGAHGLYACAVADAEALPVADGSLAGAFMFASLHHAEDPKKALAEVRRVLVPGGRFVAAIEPNSLWFGALNRLKPALERVLGKRADKSVADEEHDGFSARSLADLFVEAGFEDVRVEPVWFLSGFLHYELEFLSRLLRHKRRIRVPAWLEHALVAFDEAFFRIPGMSHLAWHWIASGKAPVSHPEADER